MEKNKTISKVKTNNSKVEKQNAMVRLLNLYGVTRKDYRKMLFIADIGLYVAKFHQDWEKLNRRYHFNSEDFKKIICGAELILLEINAKK